MSYIDWSIVILPLAFIIWMGYHSRLYIHGVADFLAAGRVCGRYVISVADVANGLAVVTLVAQVEANYKTGMAIGFWSKLTIPVGMLLALTGYCIYRYRETRSLSIGQFLEMRYNRALRLFASALRTFSETICNMIVPAVSARFFIYLLGFPHTVSLFGFQISTFALVIIVVLTLALFIIWCGGTVALIITDSIQSLLCYPVFAIFVIFMLTHFSWSQEIAPVMADRVSGESFLNPYDLSSLRDFNLFALIVTLMTQVLNQASWLGAGSSTAGRTPHEQKMAGVLGTWRNGFAPVFYFLIGAILLTVLNHANFADQARKIRTAISERVAEEVVVNPATRQNLNLTIANIPAHQHAIGTDDPLSQDRNLDTPYLQAAHQALGNDGEGNARFQEYRTLYHQLMLPMTMRSLLPVGLLGLFALLMVMLMISTDDSRIFSGAITIVQDIILPLRKTPFTPKMHVLCLRMATIGIGIIFFCGSFFMAQLDYINLFCVITTSIWLGGAGPVMVGGLYSRFGTTAGAFASLITGVVISGGGVLMQRSWADYLYPFLSLHGWAGPVGTMLETVSAPLAPYVVWQMDPVKFPINSNEIFFLSMVLGIIAYCSVSFLTMKEPFNLERMLHRGIYRDPNEKVAVPKKPSVWGSLVKLIGIDENYTRGDKIIAWSVFFFSFVYSFLLCFVGILLWNWLSPWPIQYWSYYFLIVNLVIPCIIAAISMVWFSIGGLIDLRRMFRDLKARIDNPLDDGRVNGHVSLVDTAVFTEDEKQANKRRK